MKHLIVGTAGHVDHGKTALIRYLTGTNTDRLKEEIKRGISIDIGFASLQFGDELTLGIVDVPGHERFLKNMLAGTGGIDFVMLVIAADEGIMPQTREHFEMLQCLGIRHGIVVLNKIDKVEAEWVQLVEEDVRAWLADTFLADAPVCKVSSITGTGMEELRDALLKQAMVIEERDSNAPFRLWIDRAFNLKGQGLIVTGSVLSGKLHAGDAVTIFPAGLAGKARELESHNQSVPVVGAGQRASVKLAGVPLADVGRGMYLSAEGPGQTSKMWDASIHWKTRFPSGTRIRLHIGTGEFIGRMSFTKTGGEKALVRLHLEEPISGGLGDQGLLRRYSPQDLIGGITLLCPAERNHKRDEQLARLNEACFRQDRPEVMIELLLMAKEPPGLKEWIQLAGYADEKSLRAAIVKLVAEKKVKQAGKYYVASGQVLEYQSQTKKVLEDYHRQHPDTPGISRETLRQKIKLPANIADWFLQEAVSAGLAKIQEEFVAAPSHALEHGQNTEQLRTLFETIMNPKELVEVTPQWLAEKMQRSQQEIKPFFEVLTRDGTLLRIAGVHVYRKTIQYIGSVIQAHFAKNETMSVGELRDLLNTSRRLAIPVMEYFDSHNYTKRKGDVRVPGPNLNNLSE